MRGRWFSVLTHFEMSSLKSITSAEAAGNMPDRDVTCVDEGRVGAGAGVARLG